MVFLLMPAAIGCGESQNETSNEVPVTDQHTNRLANEQSPYLLQHQHNPVNWYPWGEEAFAKAKAENKPVFLSIGYSTCHWCHVMEHESFEDEEVAALMNEVFISIKVDREERPDIDNIYMTVCQMMTQRGGWPMTIIMTPEKKPFFAGTYFPKRSLMDLTRKIQTAWTGEREKIFESADKITAYLQDHMKADKGSALDESVLRAAHGQLTGRFDAQFGGFGSAPKFPTPHNLLFLLRWWKRTGDPQTLAMVEKTLTEMRRGGIFDHVGLGFHRYSTDQRWFLPHFEKMLYDQALLALAYLEGYQAGGKAEYARTAREIFTYILRDMRSPEGGFYSAEDADSEGEEGKFYLWTEAEIQEVLGKEEGQVWSKIFGTEPAGNYHEEASGHQTGTNHFFLNQSWTAWARELELAEATLKDRLEQSRKKLFAVREKRIHPYKDDKVLTDWNGLMIAALARGTQVLGEPQYAQAAQAAVDFIFAKLTDKQGQLLHRYRQGQAGIMANVDDYAFMIWGLLELYEAGFNAEHLKRAMDLNEQMMARFWDDANGGFYFTPDDGEKLLVRQKEIYDGAVPSGNSIAMLNLYRLARLTGKMDYEANATAVGQAFSVDVAPRASAHTMLMCAVDFSVGPSYEVVIAGKAAADDTRAMVAALRKPYLPSKVVLLRPTDKTEAAISQLAGYTQTQIGIDGKATAYVCQNFTCAAPTTEIKSMLNFLGVK